MNDNELITRVRDSVADVHTTTPVAQIISRGRAVRAVRRIPAAAGALAVTAGIAVAVTTLLPGGAARAYAVTPNQNGTVTLAVYRESGIAQANARLRQLGDNVVVVPVEPGCPVLGSLPPPAVQPDGPMTVYATGSDDGSVTVNAQGIPDGDIMVVGVQTAVQGTRMASQLTSPPPPNCVSLPASSSSSGPGTH